MINDVFTKMYVQLAQTFNLPELKQTSTALFDGIQNLGSGLMQMGQIMAITAQHNSAAPQEEA